MIDLNDNGARVARNLIKKYGPDKFLQLVSMLEDNKSGPEIAEAFGVTRQRVSQWRSSLGVTVTIFNVSEDVERVVRALKDEEAAVG